jgi:hypothetical protein
METAIVSLKDTMVTDTIQRAPHSETLEIEAQAMKAIEMDGGFS